MCWASRKWARAGSLVRYQAPGTAIGGIVDLHGAGGFLPARLGGGSVHHIAFRAKDDAEEMEMVKKLAENHGIRATEQKDRKLLSLGLLPRARPRAVRDRHRHPGFAVDEPASSLGQALKLPFLPRTAPRGHRGCAPDPRLNRHRRLARATCAGRAPERRVP